MKHIIIGGVAAGMSAAAKIKRMQPDADVRVYEKGEFFSYSACGLPYFVAGYNDDISRLFARSREQLEAQGIKTFPLHEVQGVDTHSKTVLVKNHATGEVFRDFYDKLMVAAGARPMIPDLPGVRKRGVFTLKTVNDALALKQAALAYGVRDVVVVGAGFAGIEATEAMRALGKNVVCLEAAERMLLACDMEMEEIIRKELAAQGVDPHMSEPVAEFAGGEAVKAVVTQKGRYPADLVVLAAGSKPATEFLAGSGIETNAFGAVIVDDRQRASMEDVFAAGDCVLVPDFFGGPPQFLPMGTYANKCGRVAGTNMCGGNARFPGALGSAALRVFDLEFGRTGLCEEDAARAGFHAAGVVVEAPSHPASFPGAEAITIKLVYEKPSMRILGAQLAGKSGAALRADIFATAIQAGMTTHELGWSDLVYSPPFSGVWDAVQIACNAANRS